MRAAANKAIPFFLGPIDGVSGEDRLTGALQALLEEAAFRELPTEEQFGIVVTAVFLRSFARRGGNVVYFQSSWAHACFTKAPTQKTFYYYYVPLHVGDAFYIFVQRGPCRTKRH